MVRKWPHAVLCSSDQQIALKGVAVDLDPDLGHSVCPAAISAIATEGTSHLKTVCLPVAT